MRNFYIQCPNCGAYNKPESKLLILRKHNIQCACGYIINTKKDRMTVEVCPHCGNSIAYDQRKAKNTVCPICKKAIDINKVKNNNVEITCPSCSTNIQISKDQLAEEGPYECPLCKAKIDVRAQMAKRTVMERGIASLIKYEGDNNTFVWKHPVEDFNLGSQLIVHESQEALFFLNGHALDLFGHGNHILETEKLPILNEMNMLPTGTNASFHAEVFFINLVEQMGIKWGTDTKVGLFDPISGVHVEIGAGGEFSIKIVDSRKLVVKLVGTTMQLTQDDAKRLFRSMIISEVKSNLVKSIKNNGINILEVDEHLDEISVTLRDALNKHFIDYGLEMTKFFVDRIVFPEDKENENLHNLKNQYGQMFLKVKEEQIKEAQSEAAKQRETVDLERELMRSKVEAQKHIMSAEAEAREMQLKGYNYQQETARQVGVGAVTNPSGGEQGPGGNLIGLGVELSMLKGIMDVTGEAINPITSKKTEKQAVNTWNCTCGQQGIQTRFCGNCGAKRPEPQNSKWICKCGVENTGKFCTECGERRPE